MALTYHTSSKYFRMTVPPNQRHGYYNFGQYTNTSGSSKVLKSITLYLGSGKGTFTAGTTVTGTGGSFALRIYTGSSSSGNFGSATITNAMAPTSGGYPNVDNCRAYTFTFNNPVTVANGSTVQLWWETQDRNDNKCLIFDPDRGYVTESSSNYTVTFDLNGGTRTGGGALTQTVASGGSATPPTCSRTGYTFVGWDGSYTNVTSNRTITALWEINTYTVTYNANGGSGAPGRQTKTYGQALTLSSTVPTRTQCRFRTWNTRSDGTGTSYAPGASYTANAAVTLYAIWDYRIILDGNGGIIDTGNESVESITGPYIQHGQTYTIPDYGVYQIISGDGSTMETDTFQGWGSSASGPARYQPGDSIGAVTSPITLYAIFKTNSYTVIFTDGFGIHSSNPQVVPYGGSATPPTDEYVQQNWAKPGYTFSGWLGNYRFVTKDSTIVAMWGFTPIWILKGGKWVEYKAREE